MGIQGSGEKGEKFGVWECVGVIECVGSVWSVIGRECGELGVLVKWRNEEVDSDGVTNKWWEMSMWKCDGIWDINCYGRNRLLLIPPMPGNRFPPYETKGMRLDGKIESNLPHNVLFLVFLLLMIHLL